jgi:uncharacterized membrane protein YbaN (DUF454 family)
MAGHTARKHLWAALGWLNLVLGIIGAVTPLLPTTVFILMAAACFSRSHPQLEQRLLDHPRFGPAIRDWRTYRGMRRQTKRTALLAMAISFAISISLLAHAPVVQAMLAALWLGLSAWILHLPTITASSTAQPLPQCALRHGVSEETARGHQQH